MSRYLKVALLIGGLTSLVWVGAHSLGLFLLLDNQLALLLGFPDLPDQPGMRWVSGVTGVLFGLGLAWCSIEITRLETKLAIGFTALFEVVTMMWVFSLYELYFSPFAALLAGGSALAAGVMFSETEAGSRLRLLRQALGRRVSDPTFVKILNSRKGPILKGELREASILVCEWVGQDAAGAELKPEEWVEIHNRLSKLTSSSILNAGGYLDQMNGTGTRGVFGVPYVTDDHGVVVCEVALDLLRQVDELNTMLSAEGRPGIDYRMGINTGVLMAGVISQPGVYTVSGDVVERAHALCRENLAYGSRILIGGRTVQAAEGKIESRPIELLRGDREEDLDEVHELLGRKDQLTPEEIRRRDAFWNGVIFFRSHRWEEAMQHFLTARPSPDTLDIPLEIYLSRLDQLRSPVRRGRLETIRRLHKL